jgi:hypothetical protein
MARCAGRPKEISRAPERPGRHVRLEIWDFVWDFAGSVGTEPLHLAPLQSCENLAITRHFSGRETRTRTGDTTISRTPRVVRLPAPVRRERHAGRAHCRGRRLRDTADAACRGRTGGRHVGRSNRSDTIAPNRVAFVSNLPVTTGRVPLVAAASWARIPDRVPIQHWRRDAPRDRESRPHAGFVDGETGLETGDTTISGSRPGGYPRSGRACKSGGLRSRRADPMPADRRRFGSVWDFVRRAKS